MTHFPLSVCLSEKVLQEEGGNSVCVCVCVCVCISEFKSAFGMILIRLLVKYEVELLTWMCIK